METVLIIGGGGREHALGWKIAQSPKVHKIFFAPGNAGTALVGENVDLSIKDPAALLQFIAERHVTFVIVANDMALEAGVVDVLHEAGISCFGPTRAAAQIEWSKAYAKEVMRDANIPTARSKTFSHVEEARAYIEKHPLPVVVKASGLAFGKGVVVAETYEEALEALDASLSGLAFGSAGEEVVIEEFLAGKECSIHALVDGTTYKLFPPSQDHKRVGDGNTGPNTGGMGSIAPADWVSQDTVDRIEREIIQPLLRELEKRGTPFSGLLFPGIMVTDDGPKVIEFNARFGDPETESYMRILDSDLFELCRAVSEHRLQSAEVVFSKHAAACVALTSGGYPHEYEKGVPISGLDHEFPHDVVIFHAGTALKEGRVVTAGGRVLMVTARAQTREEASAQAYRAVEQIAFQGMHYRTDIGKS